MANSYKITEIKDGKVSVEYKLGAVTKTDVMDARYIPLSDETEFKKFFEDQVRVQAADPGLLVDSKVTALIGKAQTVTDKVAEAEIAQPTEDVVG